MARKKQEISNYMINQIVAWGNAKAVPPTARVEILNLLEKYEPQAGEKTCLICKNLFTTTKKNQKYCSSKCADEAIKLRYFKNGYSRFMIFLRDGFRCHYCGDSPHKSPDIKLRVDHILPKNAGGLNIPENLITSCERCNLEKSGKILPDKIIDFLKQKEGR